MQGFSIYVLTIAWDYFVICYLFFWSQNGFVNLEKEDILWERFPFWFFCLPLMLNLLCWWLFWCCFICTMRISKQIGIGEKSGSISGNNLFQCPQYTWQTFKLIFSNWKDIVMDKPGQIVLFGTLMMCMIIYYVSKSRGIPYFYEKSTLEPDI